MSLPPTGTSAFETAPMDQVIDAMLRQFKRPLATFDIMLPPSLVKQIAQAVAEREPLPFEAHNVRNGLVRAVIESRSVLAQWDLNFEQSLRTTMDTMPGWETTVEFLDIANRKSNAELRIATGSALLLALGEQRFIDVLFFLLENPKLDEISTIMARRVLAFVSETEANVDDADWLRQVRLWASASGPGHAADLPESPE